MISLSLWSRMPWLRWITYTVLFVGLVGSVLLGLSSPAGAASPDPSPGASLSSASPVALSYVVPADTSSPTPSPDSGSSASATPTTLTDGWTEEQAGVAVAALIVIAGMLTLLAFASL